MEHPDTTPRNGPETLLLDLHAERIDAEMVAMVASLLPEEAQ
jgi:hypothetical protein